MRQLRAAFLAVFMALGLIVLPTRALAAQDYGITFAGVPITSENASDILGDGTASFDYVADTLTLENCAVTGNEGAGAILDAGYNDLTIELIGENVIASGTNATGIFSYGLIAFSGDGSLAVSGGHNPNGSGSYAIAANGMIYFDEDFTGTVVATGGMASATDGSSAGIFTASGLVINNGTVVATGGEAATSAGVELTIGDCKVSGGTLIAQGGLASQGGTSWGVNAMGDGATIGVSGGALVARAGATLGVDEYDDKIYVAASDNRRAVSVSPVLADGATVAAAVGWQDGTFVTDRVDPAKATGLVIVPAGFSPAVNLPEALSGDTYHVTVDGTNFGANSTMSNRVLDLGGNAGLFVNLYEYAEPLGDNVTLVGLVLNAGSSVAIKGEGQLVAVGGLAFGFVNSISEGVYASAPVTVDGPKVIAVGGPANRRSIGLECPDDKAVTVASGELVGVGGPSEGSSYGIRVEYRDASSQDCKVSATAEARVLGVGGGAKSESYGIYSSAESSDNAIVVGVGGNNYGQLISGGIRHDAISSGGVTIGVGGYGGTTSSVGNSCGIADGYVCCRAGGKVVLLGGASTYSSFGAWHWGSEEVAGELVMAGRTNALNRQDGASTFSYADGLEALAFSDYAGTTGETAIASGTRTPSGLSGFKCVVVRAGEQVPPAPQAIESLSLSFTPPEAGTVVEVSEEGAEWTTATFVVHDPAPQVAVADGEHATVGSTLFCDSSGAPLDETFTIQGGETHYAYAFLEADEGWTFADSVEVVAEGATVVSAETMLDVTTDEAVLLVILSFEVEEVAPPEPIELGVILAGRRVTSENASDIFGDGTASYDAATATLTLRNFAATGLPEGFDLDAMLASGQSLTIRLEGNNALVSGTNTYGINVAGDLAFTGDGNLSVSGGSGAVNSVGIRAAGSLVLESEFSGTVIAQGGKASNYSHGAYVASTSDASEEPVLLVAGGTLVAQGGQSENGVSYGVFLSKGGAYMPRLEVAGGVLVMQGGIVPEHRSSDGIGAVGQQPQVTVSSGALIARGGVGLTDGGTLPVRGLASANRRALSLTPTLLDGARVVASVGYVSGEFSDTDVAVNLATGVVIAGAEFAEVDALTSVLSSDAVCVTTSGAGLSSDVSALDTAGHTLLAVNLFETTDSSTYASLAGLSLTADKLTVSGGGSLIAVGGLDFSASFWEHDEFTGPNGHVFPATSGVSYGGMSYGISGNAYGSEGAYARTAVAVSDATVVGIGGPAGGSSFGLVAKTLEATVGSVVGVGGLVGPQEGDSYGGHSYGIACGNGAPQLSARGDSRILGVGGLAGLRSWGLYGSYVKSYDRASVFGVGGAATSATQGWSEGIYETAYSYGGVVAGVGGYGGDGSAGLNVGGESNVGGRVVGLAGVAGDGNGSYGSFSSYPPPYLEGSFVAAGRTRALYANGTNALRYSSDGSAVGYADYAGLGEATTIANGTQAGDLVGYQRIVVTGTKARGLSLGVTAGGAYSVDAGEYQHHENIGGPINMTIYLGDEVRLVAMPANGYEFKGWYVGVRANEGDYQGFVVDNTGELLSDSLEYSFVLADNAMIQAVFEPAEAPASIPMFRLYNRWSYEHFYTGDEAERDRLVTAGWTYEGIGWYAPTTGDPVYRLYNKWAPGGDHHYTMDRAEYDYLCSVGWTGEGIGWYSDPNQTVPVYREYNPYEQAHNHNYTPDRAEHDHLVSLGWKDEGIGWYGV